MLAALAVSPIYLAGAAALAGAAGPRIVDWLVRRLRGRGTVATSEAGELWAEAREVRQALREQIEELDELVGELRRRVAELEQANRELAAANARLQKKVEDLERAAPLSVAAELRAQSASRQAPA